MAVWDYSIFWQEAKSQLKNELTEQEFTMWFNMEYNNSSDSTILLSVPSSFYRDQIKQRYLDKIENKLFELTGQNIKIEFVIEQRSKQKEPDPNTYNLSKEEEYIIESPIKKNKEVVVKTTFGNHPLLRIDYTFDTFVVGDNNAFAYNAAMAISKNPGTAYNPCLIYGGVGMGKTHLMQAIGNYIYKDSGKKIIFITAENFTNEFIQAIRDRKTQEFKNKYRSADVLLIDDIHFLQKKIETQEEIFHTFNALYDGNKQLVFTCDRPVSELKNLNDRLRSRFERGLNVDLQPPNYETRCAILNKKLEQRGSQIPKEVIELIARNVVTNVRDLEASLIKLIAYSELVNKSVTLEVAQQQLRDTFGSPKQVNISIESIQKVIADYFSLSWQDLKGKKRTRAIAFPRQIAMYITKELTEYSTTEIGMEFGGRDHTTVMHSCQKIEEKLKSDPTMDSTIQILIRSIKDSKQ